MRSPPSPRPPSLTLPHSPHLCRSPTVNASANTIRIRISLTRLSGMSRSNTRRCTKQWGTLPEIIDRAYSLRFESNNCLKMYSICCGWEVGTCGLHSCSECTTPVVLHTGNVGHASETGPVNRSSPQYRSSIQELQCGTNCTTAGTRSRVLRTMSSVFVEKLQTHHLNLLLSRSLLQLERTCRWDQAGTCNPPTRSYLSDIGRHQNWRSLSLSSCFDIQG